MVFDLLEVIDVCGDVLERETAEIPQFIDQFKDLSFNSLPSEIHCVPTIVDKDESFNLTDLNDMLSAESFWDEMMTMNIESMVKDSNDKKRRVLAVTPEFEEQRMYVGGTEGNAESMVVMGAMMEVAEALDDLSCSTRDFVEAHRDGGLDAKSALTPSPLRSLNEVCEGSPDLSCIQDFLNSEGFWDELYTMQCEKVTALEPGCSDWLETLNDCGVAIESLSRSQNAMMDELREGVPLRVMEVQGIDMSGASEALISNMIDFVGEEGFWNEIMTMEMEGREKVDSCCTNIASRSSHIDETVTVEVSISSHEDEVLVESLLIEDSSLALSASDMIESTSEDVIHNTQPHFDHIPTTVKEALRHGSLTEDLDVVCMKKVPQIVLGKPSEDENEAEHAARHLIDTEIDTRLRKGPDVQSTAYMFIIAFATISVVAFSSSVYESPKLFRGLWAAAFAINVVAVSMPGRLDRMYSEGNHVKPWQTLFEPCSWAFAIWGVIYGLELLLTLYVVLIGFPPTLFQVTIPYWLAGNWFQALWCFVFRAEFKKSLWVPTLCLALGAVAYGCAHCVFSVYLQKPELSMPMQALLVFLRLPMSLHSSWLVCGALLNLNSWVAVSVGRGSRGLQVMCAYASAFITALFGVMMSAYSRDPCFALTAAWALDAVSARTLSKAKEPKGIVSADVQESLGSLESMLSGGVKCVAVALIASGLYSFF